MADLSGAPASVSQSRGQGTACDSLTHSALLTPKGFLGQDIPSTQLPFVCALDESLRLYNEQSMSFGEDFDDFLE